MTNSSFRRRIRRVCAAGVALAAGVGLLAACTTGSNPGSNPGSATTTATTSAAPSTPSSSAPAQSQTPTQVTLPKKIVKVTSLESDGGTYGIGMPIVLYFSPAPTDSSAFTKAVTVTVDGKPAGGSWYWEQPDADEVARNIVEAHYRPQAYWKAHSQIHVGIPIGGLSAGTTKTDDLVYSNKLTSLDYSIGAAHISTVNANGNDLAMTVTSDGKVQRTFPVSLGTAQTPTYKGIKVVMQKGEDVPGTNKLRPNGTVRMIGTGSDRYDLMVQWSVRITQSGEYIHAAPWNSQIGKASTSNGCTNLTTADAKWFYGFSQLGDVVKYPNAPGPLMRAGDGLGDWNVPWPVWEQGGLLVNH